VCPRRLRSSTSISSREPSIVSTFIEQLEVQRLLGRPDLVAVLALGSLVGQLRNDLVAARTAACLASSGSRIHRDVSAQSIPKRSPVGVNRPSGGYPLSVIFDSRLHAEVPQPQEPVTPAVPDAPVSPVVPDPEHPADPEEPARIPNPAEPPTPAVPEPGPELEPGGSQAGACSHLSRRRGVHIEHCSLTQVPLIATGRRRQYRRVAR